jgi:hypothetical protein
MHQSDLMMKQAAPAGGGDAVTEFGSSLMMMMMMPQATDSRASDSDFLGLLKILFLLMKESCTHVGYRVGRHFSAESPLHQQ